MKLSYRSLVVALCLCVATLFAAEEPAPLRVALYPYVPVLADFQETVLAAWKKDGHTRPIEFVAWDYYFEAYRPDLDVLPTDPIYLSKYVADGNLLPLPATAAEDPSDLYDFARAAGSVDGVLYGVPQMLCTTLLFYRPDDELAAKVTTFAELLAGAGARQGAECRPPNGEGLLAALCTPNDLAIVGSKYAKALGSQESADRELSAIRKLAGRDQLLLWDEKEPSVRARWFSEGAGRWYYDYPESASHFTPEVRQSILFHALPAADTQFYVNLYSVSKGIAPEKRDDAIALVALMTRADVVSAAIAPANRPRQYLLPARKGVLKSLAHGDRIYQMLLQLVENPANRAFGMPADVLEHFDKEGKRLQKLLDL